MLIGCGLVSGCALSPALDAGLERAESVSGSVTERSLDWLCNRMSLRQWRESFGVSQERVGGWIALCAPGTSVPLSGSGLLSLPPTERDL